MKNFARFIGAFDRRLSLCTNFQRTVCEVCSEVADISLTAYAARSAVYVQQPVLSSAHDVLAA
jgi:hypothetical protein